MSVTLLPPLTVQPKLAIPSKYSVPPLTVTFDFIAGVEAVETIMLEPFDGVLNAATSVLPL